MKAGFAVVIALLIAVAGIGLINIDAVNGNTKVILNDRFVKLKLAHDIENDTNKQLRALRTALIATDAKVVERELAKVEAVVTPIAAALQKLADTVHSEKGKAALKNLVDSQVHFRDSEHRVVELIKAGKIEDGRAFLINTLLPHQDKYLQTVDAFADTQADSMVAFGSEAAAVTQRAILLMLALSAAAVLIAVVIAYALTRSITVPIGDALRVVKTVADGDLTSTIEVRRADELGELLSALQSMNGQLVDIVGRVRQSSDSIATGSTQIASGNADLSQRTEQQASNLQQTAASMEEINATIAQSADSAKAAAELAESASDVATKGSAAVAQVVSTMGEISASSRRISDITSVIDGIAFQTNILALNAAVEAARAGEQGRGFAVVASEVRSLAQRAAVAAKEIKTLIGESVERIDAGAQVVGGAGTTMEEIVQQVRRVAELNAQIGAAANQQRLGIGQVSEAVSQLDQVTQQNAALVEESAAAAESLSQQARQLTSVVSAFRLRATA